MTVYVDSMRMRARVGRFTANWSHLTADTTEELVEFAARLGLKLSWIQNPGHVWKEHFDVTDSKRELAIRLGAQPITMQEACALWASKRQTARVPKARRRTHEVWLLSHYLQKRRSKLFLPESRTARTN